LSVCLTAFEENNRSCHLGHKSELPKPAKGLVSLVGEPEAAQNLNFFARQDARQAFKMPQAPSAAPAAAVTASSIRDAVTSRSPAAARRSQLGQAKAGGGGHNITVAVRVRPLNSKEVQRNSWSCLSLQEGRQINVADPDDKMGGVDYLRLDKTKDKSYAFDHALDESMSQEDVFQCTTQSLVPGCLLGHNSCVFAYGATGSGKTFTMTGSVEQPEP